MKIRIYSAGDDEIRVEGDIEAEGCARFEKRGYVVLDTGDVFGVGPRGSISHIAWSGDCTARWEAVTPGSTKADFFVEGPFSALRIYQSWPVDDEELKDLLEEVIEEATVRGRLNLSRDKLIAAIGIISDHPMVGLTKVKP